MEGSDYKKMRNSAPWSSKKLAQNTSNQHNLRESASTHDEEFFWVAESTTQARPKKEEQVELVPFKAMSRLFVN